MEWERKNQILEAENTKIKENQKIKKSLKKIANKEKKVTDNIEKKEVKKKTLIRRKK